MADYGNGVVGGGSATQSPLRHPSALLASTPSLCSKCAVWCKLVEETNFVYIKNIVRIIANNKGSYFLYLYNSVSFVDLCRGCFSMVNVFSNIKTLLEAARPAIRN